MRAFLFYYKSMSKKQREIRIINRLYASLLKNPYNFKLLYFLEAYQRGEKLFNLKDKKDASHIITISPDKKVSL